MKQIARETPPFTWIAVTAPSAEELQAVAAEYGLHPLAVQDCLDPEHLPKYEKLGATTFVILRAFDESAAEDADTVHTLTRKVALFFDAKRLITISRAPQGFLEGLKGEPPRLLFPEEPAGSVHVLALVNGAIDTFWKPLADAEKRLTDMEPRTVKHRERPALIHELFHIKRRLNALRSTARHTLETVKKLTAPTEENLPASPRLTDARENAESLYFATDEIIEDVTNLLQLALAAADHDTNEVVRVLTVFSVFFLPLTFIVGVYGMNFDVMPELRWRFGYPLVWGFMLACCLSIYLWFRKKDWL
jgi:magnesium transporter